MKALSERWRNLPPLVQQVAAEYRAWVRTGQTELRVRRQGAGAAALVEAQRRADRHFRELWDLQARFEGQLAGAQYSYARNQDRTYETAQTLAVRTALMMLAALVLLAVWLRRAVGAPADALPLPSLRAGQVVGLADLDEVATTNALHELVAKMGSAPWPLSRCCPGAASWACSPSAGPSATSSTASRRPCSGWPATRSRARWRRPCGWRRRSGRPARPGRCSTRSPTGCCCPTPTGGSRP